MQEEDPAYGFFSEQYFLISTIIIHTKTLQVLFDLKILSPKIRPKYIVETLKPNDNILLVWDQCNLNVKTFKISKRPKYTNIAVDILGETNAPEWYPKVVWHDETSNQINVISNLSEQGHFSLLTINAPFLDEENVEVYDFHNFNNQSVGNHHPFKTCLQPTYVTSFERVVFAVFYYNLKLFQLCIVDTYKNQESGVWMPHLNFIEIGECDEYFDIFEGPGGQLLIRLSQAGKQIVQIYDCPQSSLLHLQDLQCIGSIDLHEIPNFFKVYPITSMYDQERRLIYASYFISSYIEFSSGYEHLNLVKCRRTIREPQNDEIVSNDERIKADFKYDIMSFPPSRYLTTQEMTNNWHPVLIKNLSYLPEAQIPKSFLCVKQKQENGRTCRYAIQIKTLPKCLK